LKIPKGYSSNHQTVQNIEDLNTPCKVAEYFRSIGKNIIPIVPGTKVPPRGFPLESYFDKKCDVPIKDYDSIAILHGKISNTYAIDIDMKDGRDWKEAVHVVAKDIDKILRETMVVKTPKQGCHFIVEPIGDLPPKNTKYYNKDKSIEIDVRTQGAYTLLPPSIHPEKHLGKYQFISSTLKPNPTSWVDFESHLASKGFFLKEDIDNGDLHNDYDLDKLLRGKFARGTRRKSLNSLYCKMRVRRWSEALTVKKVQEINRKLAEPLSEKELDYNIKYSENFFSTCVKPALADYKSDDKQSAKKRSKRFSPYDAAGQLMEEFYFISHVSGEIYFYIKDIYRKRGKDLISTKCRQYWEVLEIDTTMINEVINIIRDKTRVPTENDNDDIFDQDYTKLILINGVYDLEKMELIDHSPKILSTIKHPIFYDETKTCPKFDKFISSCFDGDIVRITQVWEMMALCLIKKYIIQKGYVNYGIGSNGKSTFLAILRNMLGINTTSSIPMQQFQNSPFIGHEIRGKCANISADGGTEPITKTGFIKGVLGGDAIRCEEKFKNPYDHIPFVTLIFTFNELPSITDSSDGFARKIQTIHWDQQFYGEKRDMLVEQISTDKSERSGIFNKLIPIMKRLLDTRKLQYESSVEDTKAVWLLRSDSFFRFSDEYLEFGDGKDFEIRPDHLWGAYNQFCREVKMSPVKKIIFNQKLKESTGSYLLDTSRDDRSVRVWRGVRIKNNMPIKQTDSSQPTLDHYHKNHNS